MIDLFVFQETQMFR